MIVDLEWKGHRNLNFEWEWVYPHGKLNRRLNNVMEENKPDTDIGNINITNITTILDGGLEKISLDDIFSWHRCVSLI